MNHDKTILVEDNEIISENEQISESFNNFFANAIINLNIPQYEDPTSNTDGIDDPVLRAIEKSKNHPSMKLIKLTVKIMLVFVFRKFKQLKLKKN